MSKTKNLTLKCVAIAIALVVSLLVIAGCNNSNSSSSQKKEDFSIDKLTCMTDLHLHLDGAITVDNAKKLASMQNIPIPATDAELEKLIRVPEDCSDLNEFLTKFDFPCSLIQTKEGITASVKNLLAELDQQGVMYVEIRFAPQKSMDKGLTQEQVVQAALDGTKDSNVDCNFILCCMRGDDNKKLNMDTIDVTQKFLGKGVVAADLAGAEALFKTETFKDVFEYAKSKNVPFTLHAGEADGPESVKSALSFGTKRIGHGVNSRKDSALMKELATKKIPLEMCPTSNVNTQVFKSISEYPLKEFLDAGIIVTINTDDPAIEGTTIKGEFKKLIKEFNLGKDEIKDLLSNSINSSFANDDTKAKMKNKLEDEFSKFN